MSSKLKEILRELAGPSMTESEIEQAERNVMGFGRCLLAMKMEIIYNESSNINKSINQNARRRVEPGCTKEQTDRVC